MKKFWIAGLVVVSLMVASCAAKQEVASGSGPEGNPDPRPVNPNAQAPADASTQASLLPNEASGAPVGIGHSAPDFTVTTLEGKEVKLSSLRGKPVLLDFWATWCPPCRASLPHTQKVASMHGDKIHVLAISDESKETIQKFMKDNKYTFPAHRDPSDDAMRLYKVDSIPTFVILDAKGNLVFYQSGYGGDEPIDAALAKVGITM